MRPWRVEDVGEWLEGERVGVEVYPAVVTEDLEAHYVGDVGDGLAVGILDCVWYEMDVVAEASDPWVGGRIEFGLDGAAGGRDECVVEVDGVGFEGYDGASNGEVVYKVELNPVLPSKRFCENVYEAHDIGNDVCLVC